MISRALVFICFYAFSMLCLWIADIVYFDIFGRYEGGKVLPIYFGAGLGIALTMFMLFLVADKIRNNKQLGLLSKQMVVTYALVLLVLPFAFIAGVTIGGTIGGGVLDVIFNWLNLNVSFGIPIGIGLGIFVVSFIVTLPALFIGYYLGGLVSRKKK